MPSDPAPSASQSADVSAAYRAVQLGRQRYAGVAAARRNAVCTAPDYPGSPSDYSYVPEHCKPRKGTTRASNAEQEAIMAALRRTPLPPVMVPAALSELKKLSLPKYVAMQLHQQVQSMPLFMVYATSQFKKLKASRPDPDARYDAICEAWAAMHRGAVDFKTHRGVRAAVLSLALTSRTSS